jgi:hypothetical protein
MKAGQRARMWTVPSCHRLFNECLRELENRADGKSGFTSSRKLSELHNSVSGYIAGFIGYFLHSMRCDYDIGRDMFHALHWAGKYEGQSYDGIFEEWCTEQGMFELFVRYR